MTDKVGFAALLRRNYLKGYLSELLFAGLTIVALAVAFQQFYIINVNTDTRYTLLWHIPFNLFYFWYWFAVFPVIYRIRNEFRTGEPRTLYWIGEYFVFPSAFILVHQVLASFVINFSLDYLDIPELIYRRILRNPWLSLDVVIYFAIMIAVDVFEYRRKNREDSLRLTQIQGQLVRAQLNTLESQLHPHFLFNALNAASTLVLKREREEAEKMLTLLRGFLETTLLGSEKHMVTLEEELGFINRYLEIEKVRFADRIEVFERVEPGLLRARVPNLLLQPIVENAVRYAVAPGKVKGRISISAMRERDRLAIYVEDDGPGPFVSRKREGRKGLGLKITRDRLSWLFGNDFILDLSSPPDGGTKVAIEIPYLEDVLTSEEESDAR